MTSRTDTLEISVTNRDTVGSISRSREAVERVISGGVEVVGKQIGGVVVHGGQPLRVGLFSVLIDLHLFNDQVRIGRRPDPLRIHFDPEHRPGLGLEFVDILVTFLLQHTGDIAGNLNLLCLVGRIVRFRLNSQRSRGKINRHRIGDTVIGLESVFKGVQASAERLDPVATQTDVPVILGNRDLDDHLLQFAATNTDPGRLSTGQVPTVERKSSSRSRHSGRRPHKIDMRVGVSGQQVRVTNSAGKSLIENLDDVFAVGRDGDR